MPLSRITGVLISTPAGSRFKYWYEAPYATHLPRDWQSAVTAQGLIGRFFTIDLAQTRRASR